MLKDVYDAPILYQYVLLENERVVPSEIHGPAAIYWQTVSHVVVSSIPRHGQESKI